MSLTPGVQNHVSALLMHVKGPSFFLPCPLQKRPWHRVGRPTVRASAVFACPAFISPPCSLPQAPMCGYAIFKCWCHLGTLVGGDTCSSGTEVLDKWAVLGSGSGSIPWQCESLKSQDLRRVKYLSGRARDQGSGPDLEDKQLPLKDAAQEVQLWGWGTTYPMTFPQRPQPWN